MLHLARVGDVDVSALYAPGADRASLLTEFGLQERKWKDGQLEYTILQYRRPIKQEEHGAMIGHLRSVVHRDGRILCVAPPRAITMETFALEHPASK